MILGNNILDFKLPYASLLSKSELENLFSKSNLVNYKNKEYIFKQNTRTSHITLIKSGLVKVFQENRNDKYQIIYLATEGSFIGLTSIFGDELYHNSASSLGKSEIWNIDLSVFKNLMLTNGKFATKILEMVCKESLFINQRLLGQISKQLPGRIADVLLYFAEDIFKTDTFEVPLTRKELAELSGTTKESFIRTLTEFKNDKIIDINGSTITIKSMEIIKTLHNLG